MKMLLAALLISFAPAAHAELNVLGLYAQVLTCTGTDKISGHEISFKVKSARYDGRKYGSKKISKIRLGNEKLNAIHLAQNTVDCEFGYGNYVWSIKDNEFKLSIECSERVVKAKGTCKEKGFKLGEE